MGNLVVIIVVLIPLSFTVRYKRVAKTIANLVLVAEKLESPPQARSKEKGAYTCHMSPSNELFSVIR